jgi:hypothetical protein
MQKEIERNLNLRNEIRHRIITADNVSEKKPRASQQEGLKYLVSERENGGLASLSASTSSSTNSSSILSTVMKKNDIAPPPPPTPIEEEEVEQQPPKPPVLRPASFLTGFGGFGTEAAPGLGIGNKASANFITRGIPPRTFTSRGNNEPSISTKFFQRITSRLDSYDKKIIG